MSTLPETPRGRKVTPPATTDLREQLYNGGEVGPIERVQLPSAAITTQLGFLLDIDPHLYRPDAPVAGLAGTPKKILDKALGRWLGRHPALAGAEVRDSGRGLHVIVRLDPPVAFASDAERRRWEGIAKVVQAALPVDPDQPGLTALTRAVGSKNGKSGRAVTVLRAGTPTPVAAVLDLYEQMTTAPFRTVTGILFGADRVSPCPICKADGSTLAALDRVGRCYGSCGTVTLEALYDAFLLPRDPREGGRPCRRLSRPPAAATCPPGCARASPSPAGRCAPGPATCPS